MKKRAIGRADQEMVMVVNEAPCIAAIVGLRNTAGKQVQEAIPILIIFEKHAPIQAAGHDMIEAPRYR